VGSNRRRERVEERRVHRAFALYFRDGLRTHVSRGCTRGQLLHVVRLGPHPISRRKPFTLRAELLVYLGRQAVELVVARAGTSEGLKEETA
jgi:hypothetical protein